MALFTAASVERVKEASDIVEVISAHTELRRSGVRYTGLCPFHDERSPSFSVDPTDKLYHCFGCGVGGDVIKFVEEKEGLAFPDAVEALADRYGVELERESEDPRAEEQRRKRARLTELLERTAGFYGTFLRDAPQASRARDYLASRGLGSEALDEFGVGCAPGTWDTVLMRGQKAGYSIEEIEAAGLILKSQKGRGHYDRFRSRIIFPIRDARGRVQGFGARALLPDQKPKYVNSPEGELYSKRRTLYGIERSRAQIVKSGRAVVVEGYTDVIACHQAGIRDAVAIMGTAITPEQVKLLSAYAEEAVLALDADRAGREAMLRAQAVGGKRLRLRVARMPEGKDPADLLAGGDGASATAFRNAIEAAEDLPVFHVHTLLDDGDLSSPSGRDRALDEVVGGDRRDARLDHARGADARSCQPPRRRPRAGRAAHRGGGQRAEAGGARPGARGRAGGRAAAARADAGAELARAARAGVTGDVRASCRPRARRCSTSSPTSTSRAQSRPAPGSGCATTSTTRWRASAATTRNCSPTSPTSRCAPRRSPPAPRRWSSACSSWRSRSSTTRSRPPRPTAAPRRSNCSAAAQSSRSGSRGRSRSLGGC